MLVLGWHFQTSVRIHCNLRLPYEDQPENQRKYSAMPHIDSLLQECEGSKCVAEVNFCHRYWQIVLQESSQQMMSIQTPGAIYSPARVLQSVRDSGSSFQALMKNKFKANVLNLIPWIYNFLLYAKTEDHLLYGNKVSRRMRTDRFLGKRPQISFISDFHRVLRKTKIQHR